MMATANSLLTGDDAQLNKAPLDARRALSSRGSATPLYAAYALNNLRANAIGSTLARQIGTDRDDASRAATHRATCAVRFGHQVVVICYGPLMCGTSSDRTCRSQIATSGR